MSDPRAAQTVTESVKHWIIWIRRALRPLLTTPHAPGSPAGGRAAIVQHTRAGDVYRL